ncbi:MAG: TAXI family TRAP transporter solute-binding subunit [Pygmaiobacter sp.]
MKKAFSLFLALCMATVMLTACGSTASSTASASAPASGGASVAESKIPEEFLSLGTSSSGGTFNTLGVALCQTWGEKITPTSFTAEVTAGSSENCLRVGMDEIQAAFAAASSVYEAVNGTGAFEGKKVEGIKGIACLYPAIIQIPVLKSSGIEDVKDITDKKINIGEAGSGSESTILGILKSLEISTDSFNVQQMSHSNAATAVCDEKIDGYMISGSSGQSHQMTAMASGKCKMLSFTDDEIAAIIKDAPYYYEYTMKAETYPNQDADINTVATGTLLICNETISDELVYEMAKTLFESLDTLEQSQAIASEIKLENAMNMAGVELHPGAARYYKEVGLMK